MSKKTWILIACLVMSLAMGLGGSLAYLTDRDADANVFTMGNVDIELTEDFEQGSELTPGVKVEKDVKVANIGPNTAWVWVEIAIPTELDTPADASANVVHFNYEKGSVEAGKWNWWTDEAKKTWNVKENVAIDDSGINYNIYTVLYETALAAGETTEASAMFQVYMDTRVDIDPKGDLYVVENGNVKPITWNIYKQGAPIMHVSAYAIQKDGFATVQEGYAAYNKQWGDNGKIYGEPANSISTDEELKAALTANEEVITVNLTADVTYEVAAWDKDAMGSAATKRIVINGNGNTLTFNQTNSDWNNVVTNGATLVLNNVEITNDGHNDGPWNRHDINFGCDVELNNVTSDKALAFKAGAKLTNVTIEDANTSATYAIWIQPNGQTVTLDSCTIDMLACTDGRGIKIDEQYVDAPAKVTLVVKNTTVKTEAKGAILVKSAVGADVILENVDISGVAADSVNAVWVDSDSADYFDLVTVTGGTKVQE